MSEGVPSPLNSYASRERLDRRNGREYIGRDSRLAVGPTNLSRKRVGGFIRLSGGRHGYDNSK